MDRSVISSLCSGLAEQADSEVLLLWDNFLSKIERNWFIEIGVKWGGTSKVWEECGFKNGIGIDLEPENFKADITINYQLVSGNSLDMVTFDKVKGILGDTKVDFLFIDGAHNYNDCKSDFNTYKELVREGGIIAFHDILPTDMGVRDVFKEIENDYKDSKRLIAGHTGIGAFTI